MHYIIIIVAVSPDSCVSLWGGEELGFGFRAGLFFN